MISLHFLFLAFGTALIRILHAARRRLFGADKYFSFSDFLVEESHVHTRGFFYMALPPLVGGGILALLPELHPIVAVGAGFLSAFLGVWPVFQFPFHLLDEYLLPHWAKLKFLYVLFIGFSTSLSYLGFVLVRTFIPLAIRLSGTGAWRNFLDSLAANAIYDLTKATVLGLFVLSGIYVSGQRKKIGTKIEVQKQKDWHAKMADPEYEDS